MFFIHEQVTDHIIRIRDISLTASYLVVGDEKTALIDTGIGSGNIREYIEKEIKKHVDLVILTHGHLDHASGAGSFYDVPIYLNPADRELMSRNVGDRQLRFDYINRMHSSVRLPLPEPVFDDLIEGYDSLNTLPVIDKDEFDLGSVTLKMIHVPGHTMGSMMVLFKEERIMLFGDACGPGTLLVEDTSATIRQYRDSLLYVKQYEDAYDRVIRNHGTCESPKEILDNVIDVCAEILEGKDDKVPTSSFISKQPVFLAKRISPSTREREDGKTGNITYLKSKAK